MRHKMHRSSNVKETELDDDTVTKAIIVIVVSLDSGQVEQDLVGV